MIDIAVTIKKHIGIEIHVITITFLEIRVHPDRGGVKEIIISLLVRLCMTILS